VWDGGSTAREEPVDAANSLLSVDALVCLTTTQDAEAAPDKYAIPRFTNAAYRHAIKYVQERLGHRSAMITFLVYAHVLPGEHARYAEQLAERLDGT